jgi:hypothetical protein
MSRSPLAYPLRRAADTDVGGAADLQTDVMRFMAILALCLVAIFALVQSIPLVPEPAPVEQRSELQPRANEPVVQETTRPPPPAPAPAVAPPPEPVEQQAVVLTRPTWTPQYTPSQEEVDDAPVEPPPADDMQLATVDPSLPAATEAQGFTLRFASDAALMRAVAAHKVGVYALEPGRARRMAVSESRISFWEASMPNSFHEMEPETVPSAVVTALTGTGTEAQAVNWGVTLPGRMKAQLDALMEQHRGGALIIGASGEIHWEARQ